MHTCIVCVYIYRERDRERERTMMVIMKMIMIMIKRNSAAQRNSELSSTTLFSFYVSSILSVLPPCLEYNSSVSATRDCSDAYVPLT